MSAVRSLGAEEREALVAVADALCGGGRLPAPSETPGYEEWLDRALAARADAFEAVVATAVGMAGLTLEGRREALRLLDSRDRPRFHALSSVVAGAWLLVPEISDALGYPGQVAAPAAFDEAATQLETGILDPVIERGPFHREV
ncbi:MAG: hypothetical protein BGO11_02985 [Solirubrobacterales bacterium 70-9]|nr:MAG: hypothetical protein BGO11_02985 [Solirubrobacterales bacterium 70-9]